MPKGIGAGRKLRGREEVASLAHSSKRFLFSPSKHALRKLLALLNPTSCRTCPTPPTLSVSVKSVQGSDLGGCRRKPASISKRWVSAGQLARVRILPWATPASLICPPWVLPISWAYSGCPGYSELPLPSYTPSQTSIFSQETDVLSFQIWWILSISSACLVLGMMPIASDQRIQSDSLCAQPTGICVCVCVLMVYLLF